MTKYVLQFCAIMILSFGTSIALANEIIEWQWIRISRGKVPLELRGVAKLESSIKGEKVFLFVSTNASLDPFVVTVSRKSKSRVLVRFEPPNTERVRFWINADYTILRSFKGNLVEQIYGYDGPSGEVFILYSIEK